MVNPFFKPRCDQATMLVQKFTAQTTMSFASLGRARVSLAWGLATLPVALLLLGFAPSHVGSFAAGAACALGAVMALWTLHHSRVDKLDNQADADDSNDGTGDDPSLEDVRHIMEETAEFDLAQLASLARSDTLTGLSNRAHFINVVSDFLGNAEPGSPHCLLFIDLNGFKKVNDTLGHAIGDKLLAVCADKLRMAAQFGETTMEGEAPLHVEVARFGGDEFTVFIGDGGSGSVAQRMAKRIQRVFSDPIDVGNKTIVVGASIGIAFAPDHGSTCDELVKNADAAMYAAKRTGSSTFQVFNEKILEQAVNDEREEIAVREAFERGEMELHFQPLFDARTMEITSAEALVRWRHPARGLLPPGDFLPAIERCNMGYEFSRWVINEVAKRISQLERSGVPLMIAANISPSDLENVEFPSLVRSCISRWGCEPSLLQLEITENIAMRDPKMAARSLAQMREIGVSLAIDDFGTGYSNLAKIISLPISRLKIDRTLLNTIEESPEAFVLVQTIINLANSLGMHSVAEGVETEAQQELLQSMGCDVLQGFLLSRPIPFDKLLLLCGSFRKVNRHELNNAAKNEDKRSSEAA